MGKMVSFGVLTGIFFNLSTYSADLKRGEKLFASCVQCHGDNGLGLEKEKAPRIAGQHSWYIENQLNAFRTKKRINTKMYPYIKNLSDQDYKDLAAFVAQLR